MNFVIKMLFHVMGMLILMSFWGVNSSEIGFFNFFFGYVTGMTMYDVGNAVYDKLEENKNV